jgi:hypothetical protein
VGLVVAGVLAALALGLGVVAVVTTDSDDGSSTGETDAGETDAADGGPEEADIPDLVSFTDPDGEFEVSVPDEWVAVSMRGDISGTGAEAFPDDEARATALDQMLGAMPRLILFAAVDPETVGTRFLTNVNLVRVPAPPGGDLGVMEELAPREIAAQGGEQVGEPERVTLASGDALRIEYENEALDAEFVQFYVVADDMVWTLTFNATDLADYEGQPDAIAESFDLIG